LPLNSKQKEKLTKKLIDLLTKNTSSLKDVFLKNSDIHKNHNFVILNDLKKH
jgi:hypothetical protein